MLEEVPERVRIDKLPEKQGYLFDKNKKGEKMECPKCGAETIERRSYVGGHGDVLFEQCPGLACGWAEPMERLNTNLVQPLIRQRFEDEQGCQVWDVASMVALDNRWQRAKEIVLSKNELSYAGEGVWLVKSQSRPGVGFQVSLWAGKDAPGHVLARIMERERLGVGANTGLQHGLAANYPRRR